MMEEKRRKLTRMEQLGLTAFILGLLYTAVFIGYGLSGVTPPGWMLALTTVL